MSHWSSNMARPAMGRERGYGSEYGSSYDPALDGLRNGGVMRGLGSVGTGALGSGLRSVGLGSGIRDIRGTTYGANPWGAGPFGAVRSVPRWSVGQATDDGTVASPSGTAPTTNAGASQMSHGLAQSLSQVTTGMAALAALGTGASGAASGGLVGAIAGGKGSRMKYAGRGALAGAAIANAAATVMGGIAWVAAGSAPADMNVEAVKSGAMTFTIANAVLTALEITAIVMTGAAR